MNNFGFQPNLPTYENNLEPFLNKREKNSIINDEFSDFFNVGSLNSKSVMLGSPKNCNNSYKVSNIVERSPLNNRFPLNSIDNTYGRALTNNTHKLGLFSGNEEIDFAFNPFNEIKSSSNNLKSKDLPLYQGPKKKESILDCSLKRKFEDLEVDEYHSPTSDEAYNSDIDYPTEKKCKLNVPMTPFKKVRIREDSFAGKALKIQATNDQLVYVGDKLIQFKLNPDPHSKKCGDFVQVTEILAGQPQLYPNIKNENILHKCYKKDVIESRPGKLETYMKNSIKQHDDLLNAGFPVSRILNNPLKDGFYLVEKIEHEFPISWNKKTSIESLDVKSKWLLDQVKFMFQYAFDNEILLDLSRNNVRFKIDENENEIVYLIDFKEECDDEYYLFIEPNISTFANGNPLVADYLRPSGYVVDAPMLNKSLLWV
ncbi:MAG TPA: hypothetical protein VGP47_04730 [Parachlamydiaceae bacterium]|nr:hypothetical protein [Parachlamydiaceae bacterium]